MMTTIIKTGNGFLQERYVSFCYCFPVAPWLGKARAHDLIERKRGNRLYLEYFEKGSQSSENYIFFNFPLDGILNISILYFQVVLNIFHFGFIYIPLHFRPHSCRVGARDISLRNSISDFSEIISDHKKGISIVWEFFCGCHLSGRKALLCLLLCQEDAAIIID